MSVLGAVSKRLKTDLADYARAAVDPAFSQQLTNKQFEDQAFQRNRKAALEDAAKAREQQLADRADAEQLASQKFAVGKLFDIAMNDPSGKGWRKYMELNTSGNLRPDVQQLSDLLADGAGATSLEAKKYEYERFLDFQKAENDQIKFEFSEENRAFNELVDEKWKEDYTSAQEMLNAPSFNREMLINHLRQTKGIFLDDEKNAIITAMTDADDAQAKTIYNRAFDQANNRYQNERSVRAFPERFTRPEPWLAPDGTRIGTKQRGPDGKYVYTRDKQSPLVNMSAGDKMKFAFDNYQDAVDSASAAEKQLNNLDFIDATIGDIETGSLTDLRVAFGQLSASLNLPIDTEISSLEGARTAAGELVMAALDKFPGQISNAEREFLELRMPGLTQTREGRQVIIALLRRTAEREIVRRDMMEKYIQRESPDLVPVGEQSYFREWEQYKEENPIWEDLRKPKGTVITNPNTRVLYYESLDGQYRDKNGNLYGQ
jgi:hypothetical protein